MPEKDIRQISTRGTRIFKNTIFLYIRMFVIMIINLVAVRMLLKALGETDYGIFNVVGGVVTLLSFISSSMSSAAQRFYAYYMGKHDEEQLNRVFKVSLFTFIVIVLLVILIAETAGLWLLNNKMTIPFDRSFAAEWVFHLSIVAFSVNLLLVPFMAMVLSSERMDFFAITSMVESLLKLVIIFIIAECNGDRLIFYALLYTIIIIINFVVYVLFVRYKHQYISLVPNWDRTYFGQLFSYCSWYMYGAVATVVRSQGINILLNIFFNPAINAARGIAYQVNSAVNAFVNSFFSAVRPQVVKRFALNEMDSLRNLVLKSTILSYYLILLMSVPLIVWMPEVLGLWLTEVPEHTVLFTRLVIITSMVETLGIPITTAICADGNIKWFQIVTGTIILLNLPISYIFLEMGCPPEITMIIAIIISTVVLFVKVYYAQITIGLKIGDCLRLTLRCLLVTLLSFIVPCVLNDFINEIDVIVLFLCVGISLTCIVALVFYVGMTKKERQLVITLISKGKK